MSLDYAKGSRQSVEPIMLTVSHVTTFLGDSLLTRASGFFFEDESRLFLITSRHVLIDEPTNHFPDRIEIDLHVDLADIAQTVQFSISLYHDQEPAWRQATDSGGSIDVAAIEIDRTALPAQSVFRAFRQNHLADPADQKIGVGTPLLIVGFPLGFHDTLHHLPVARQAIIASSYGLRFQGEGYFLTDGRTHRGTSGGPIVSRTQAHDDLTHNLPWTLVGIHSASFDVGQRDKAIDETLGLNCGWYSDIILTLTQSPPDC